MKRKVTALALFFCVAGQIPAAQRAVPAAQLQSAAPAASADRPALPAYPDSAGGLKKLVKDMLAARKASNEKCLAAYLESLLLPDADRWFEQVFGPEHGPPLADSYRQRRERLPSSFALAISEMLMEKREDIQVFRFEEACDENADGREYPILLLRQQAMPFYDVRFLQGGSAKSLWFFAYVHGAFRYVGDALPPLFPGDSVTTPRGPWRPPPPRSGVRIDQRVQAAKILSQARPNYPDRARRAQLMGTVELAAIISENGSVENLRVMRGHCWLVEAAIKAVRQWRYQPTLVDGKPVSVTTTIEVNFVLSY